ncbi:MAG: prepilin-type N-terminal cleavage/methylation domain-containing protein [Candidatus Omnitrophica bacterium]|nr:prepilin-type N-terminal cleavage/methylation domain-containing protein [Candidatus Omnitrophota bacterium]
MRKGFTLIELLIVVIVIAILATFAIPQYMKAVERAKVSKGAHHIGLIAQAMKMYRADTDEYPDASTGDFGDTFVDYVELNEIDNDSDWDYTVTGDANGETFTITADRTAGPYAGQVLEINEMGEWDNSDHLLFRIPGE